MKWKAEEGFELEPGTKVYHLVPRKTPPDASVVEAARGFLQDPHVQVQEYELDSIEVIGAGGAIDVPGRAPRVSEGGPGTDSASPTPENCP